MEVNQRPSNGNVSPQEREELLQSTSPPLPPPPASAVRVSSPSIEEKGFSEQASVAAVAAMPPSANDGTTMSVATLKGSRRELVNKSASGSELQYTSTRGTSGCPNFTDEASVESHVPYKGGEDDLTSARSDGDPHLVDSTLPLPPSNGDAMTALSLQRAEMGSDEGSSSRRPECPSNGDIGEKDCPSDSREHQQATGAGASQTQHHGTEAGSALEEDSLPARGITGEPIGHTISFASSEESKWNQSAVVSGEVPTRMVYEPYSEKGSDKEDGRLPPYEWAPRTVSHTSRSNVRAAINTTCVTPPPNAKTPTTYPSSEPLIEPQGAGHCFPDELTLPPMSFYCNLARSRPSTSLPPKGQRGYYSPDSIPSSTSSCDPPPLLPYHSHRSQPPYLIDAFVSDGLQTKQDDSSDRMQRPYQTSGFANRVPYPVQAGELYGDSYHSALGLGGMPREMRTNASVSAVPYPRQPFAPHSLHVDGVESHQYKPVTFLYDNVRSDWMLPHRATHQPQHHAAVTDMW